MTSGTQPETITAGAGTQLAITSSAFSGPASASATNAFTVTLEDAYGNATTKASATTVNLTSSRRARRVRRHLGWGERDQRHPAGQHLLGHRLLRRQKPGTPTVTAAASGSDLWHPARDHHGGGRPPSSPSPPAPCRAVRPRTARPTPITVTKSEDAYGNASTRPAPPRSTCTSSSAGTHEFAATSGGTNMTSVNICRPTPPR